jgi:phage tail-like protein
MAAAIGRIMVLFNKETIQKVPLTENVLRIGRVPESNIHLSNGKVSRNHAEVRVEPQGPILTDLGSTYGTFIKGQRLLPNEPQLLVDGTAFEIGPYTLVYHATEQLTEGQDETESHPAPVPVVEPPPVITTPDVLLPPRGPEATQPVSRSLEDELDSLYLYNLPDIFQENDFLRRFLLLFEDIWEPLEQRQDHIAMYFDPRTCPEPFLLWLASWLDLTLPRYRAKEEAGGEERQIKPAAMIRYLLTQAMDLYNWRGTRYGLTRMIEVCTGITPEISEIPTRPFVFLIRITVPAGPVGEMLDRDLIEELIETHKPAHVGYILEVNI